jgi:cytochrome c5
VNDPVVPGVLVPDPTDAFSGAGTYAPNPPTIRANDQHAGGVIVTGKPCLTCHDGTTCVKFDFAGTVWTAPALTDGAVDVNVRIIDANNYAYSVYSDVDGNFWHRADTDLVMPAFSGVRTADWKAIGTLNGTSCNSCHYTGNTGPDAPPGPRLFVDP